MATEPPEPKPAERVPSLPEQIGPTDVAAVNEALAALFGELRSAQSLPPSETHERLAAVVALGAVWRFLVQFESALAEGLHLPLLSLHGSLQALNENNVAPLLKPTPAPDGGRAPDSPERQALIGFAAGAVGWLKWTGLSRDAAHKAVADALHKLGIRPGRGSGRLKARTVRGWCERVAADVGGQSIAKIQADAMLTAKWQAKIKAPQQQQARKFVLNALTAHVQRLTAAAQKPANPPS